ncbi:MAG: thioredoxin [Lachnospiraceae bacterium]|nr:thioredoxin [Lachnospiraceae bacterium]
MVKKITANEFKSEVASGVSVVDFSAEWCGPCKMLGPVLEELSNELDGKINFLNVDVDTDADLAVDFGITNIPALIVLKDGEKVDMQVGFQPKENLLKFFEQYL